MIRIGCIFDSRSRIDGTRICVARYVLPSFDYDTRLSSLAPSVKLLEEWKSGKMGWTTYKRKYLKEMETEHSKEVIKHLKERSDKGEVITLLCWEKNPIFCHRKLLKHLIEKNEE